MPPMTRRAATALSLGALALLAAAPAAFAAPDWAPPADYPRPIGLNAGTVVGFATGGTATSAHVDLVGRTPAQTVLHVAARPPGGDFADELTVPSRPDALPFDTDLAVAPDGSAVVVWTEATSAVQAAPTRFRASYRPAGATTWEEPATIVADGAVATEPADDVRAAIAPDGTAAVAITHLETNAGEPAPGQEDTRLDVAVHPRGGGWGPTTRLSTADSAVAGAALAFDADANLTVAYIQRISEGTTKSISDDRSTLIVRRRGAANGVFGAPEDLTGSDFNAEVFALRLGVNDAGAAVIAYQYAETGKRTRTLAVTRASAKAPFSASPGAPVVSSGPSSLPLGAGVSPGGTAYVTYEQQAVCVGVVRISPGGAPTPERCIAPTADAEGSEVAFLGDDAYFAWGGTFQGQPVVEGSRWLAGASGPDAATPLDAVATKPVRVDAAPDGDGGIAALWKLDGGMRATGFDAGAPRLRADGPARATTGSPVALSATAVDLWSALAAPAAWDFGDGTTSSGAAVSHVYTTPGTFTVTARVADARGNEAARSFAVTVDAPAPGTAPPPSTAPPPVATPKPKPIVKIALPACPKKASRKACARLRASRTAWRLLRGTARGAARVEVTVAGRVGKRVVTVKRAARARLKRGTWSLALPKLAAGRWTFRAVAVDAAGVRSRAASVTATLR